jgi:hypothetical protein
MGPLFVACATVAAIGGLAIAVMSPVAAEQAPHGQAVMTCTNPYSGASWQIHVDYDGSKVDSRPARISTATIWWQGADGRTYSLDRRSGNLTVTIASSTGGNFLYDRCSLDR